eukprot:GHVO01043330.1.p1 GENE.GHVO01043330.1~~GHVO01043330.1.p1  ORF type:complete len:118 (+),score=12.84 GHVO01043330.1:313-666(+)
MKVHIPEPGLSCRFEIFRGAIEELLRRQVLHCKSNRPICSFAEVSSAIQDGPSTNSEKLLAVSKLCDGLSGRALRKIPFQAFSSFNTAISVDTADFIEALASTCQREITSRIALRDT